MPSALGKFNDAEIHLYDVSTFYKNGAVKAKFIEQIKMCRWYGPYQKLEDKNSFFFFSLNNTASNEYLVRINISFARKCIVYGYQRYYEKIAPFKTFSHVD